MKLSITELQLVKQLLRNVAEVDPNDIIANRASQLAVELELLPKMNELEEQELQLIQYAFSKRNTYILEPGARHAVNLETV